MLLHFRLLKQVNKEGVLFSHIFREGFQKFRISLWPCTNHVENSCQYGRKSKFSGLRILALLILPFLAALKKSFWWFFNFTKQSDRGFIFSIDKFGKMVGLRQDLGFDCMSSTASPLPPAPGNRHRCLHLDSCPSFNEHPLIRLAVACTGQV